MKFTLGMLFGLIVGSLLPPAPAVTPLQFPPTSGDHAVMPIAIHDGDSFVFCWLVQDKARMFGINTPEVTGAQKEAGIKSREYLKTLLPLNKPVSVRVYGRDKYGRSLAAPFTADGQNIADLMIKNGFGKSWDGTGEKP